MRRPGPGTPLGALLLGALLLGATTLAAGCKGKDRTPRTFDACGKSKSCPAGRICVLTPGIAAGRCVHPCAKDTDCPKAQRCSGGFRPLGATGAPPLRHGSAPPPARRPESAPPPAQRPAPAPPGVQRPGSAPPPAQRLAPAPSGVQRYCQRATVPIGGDCSGLQDGCQPGLQCRHGKTCVRSCGTDNDCAADQRCVPVRDQRVFGTEAPTLYRTCVAATARAGGTCGPHHRPLCARGHACYRQRCIKRCEDDAACGEGRVCDGEGTAPAADGDGLEPFRYCRQKVAEGERCGRRPERDLACTKEHTCYRGRCRRLCEQDSDCPAGEGRPRRCRRKRRRGERFQICL